MSPTIMNFMQGPLCGTLATMFLYGVICMQVFHYAKNHATFDRRIKWLVGSIWLLESLHCAFSIHYVEYYLIIHFNDKASLEHIVWSIGATFLTGFIVTFIVDQFLIWRMWQLGARAWLGMLFAILALAQTGLVFAVVILGFKYTATDEFFVKVHPTMVAAWTLPVVLDCLMTVTLTYCLYRQRLGKTRSEHILDTLRAYAVNTGALMSIASLLALITFLVLPEMSFAGFIVPGSKLHVVTMLATLNARDVTRQRAVDSVPIMETPQFYDPQSTGTSRADPSLTSAGALEVRKDVAEDIVHAECRLGEM